MMVIRDFREPPAAAPAPALARLMALQRLLAAEIDCPLPGHAAAARAAVVSAGRVGSPAAGVAVYRDSSRRARERSLELVYPVCRQVLGAGCFGRLAASFVAECPSRSADLTCLATRFPGYLGQGPPGWRQPLARLPYLPHLARLELAFHMALFAADDAPWDADGFAALAAWRGIGQVRLQLARSVTLVDSDFPVHEIWRRHREGLDTAAVAAGDGDRLVVYRPALRARVQPVSHAAFRLLGAVDNGLRLAELAAGGYAVEQLGGLISDGIIIGFEPGGGGVPS